MTIKIKRAYEKALPSDGCRVLVDRLWPRGISKSEAHLEAWEKDLAPSTGLRKWYGHQPERWEAFKKRYRSELAANPAVPEFLEKNKAQQVVTLVYAAREEAYSHALVLQEFLQKKRSGSPAGTTGA